jgi:UDP-N-acetyl-D-glucosamine dehydrogenase
MLISKVSQKVSIIGHGYVGKSIAEASFTSGFDVTAFDIDEDEVSNSKSLPYEVTNDFTLCSKADVIVVAVPTPINHQYEPDLSMLSSACETLARYAKPTALIINESTSFPGTLRNFIAPRILQVEDFAVAPERVDPQNVNWNIRNTPRVISGLSEIAKKRAIDFYSTFVDDIHVVSTPEVAEATKLLENSYRLVNIAMINEFSALMKKLGIPAIDVIESASTKPFGFQAFFPSIGAGGHCIPVDPHYLTHVAREVGQPLDIINLSLKLNLKQPQNIARLLDARFSLSGKKIQIAGITYKPNVSDLRESAAIELMLQLRALGATVTWHDKLAKIWNGETSSALEPVDLGFITVHHAGVSYEGWGSDTKVVNLSLNNKLQYDNFF